MKKILSALIISAVSVTVMACPKGTTLQGGTGPHHKGGKCVAKSDVKQQQTPKKDTSSQQKTVNNKF